MLYMPYRLAVVLVASSALLVTGCDDDDPLPAPQTARVRFVNASSATTGAVSPQVGGQALGATANIGGFQQSSQCVDVPVTGSNQAITFTSGGQTINLTNALNFNFQPNQRYTVVLFGTATGNRQAVVFTDPATNFQAPANQNAIRFVNAFGQTGSIFVTTPTGQVGNTADVANLQTGQASTGGITNTGFFGFPIDRTLARFFTGATTGNPQAQFTISGLPTSRIGTVVFTPAPQGGTATGFLVQPCP